MQVNGTVRKYLKYATINASIFCGNRQHSTDVPDNASVSNNPKYSFSENFKGDKDGCPFKRVDADVTWLEEIDIPAIVTVVDPKHDNILWKLPAFTKNSIGTMVQ